MLESAAENLNKICVLKNSKKTPHQLIKYLEDLCPISLEGRVYQCCQKVIYYIPVSCGVC